MVKTRINAAANNLLGKKLNMISSYRTGKAMGTDRILFRNESPRHGMKISLQCLSPQFQSCSVLLWQHDDNQPATPHSEASLVTAHRSGCRSYGDGIMPLDKSRQTHQEICFIHGAVKGTATNCGTIQPALRDSGAKVAQGVGPDSAAKRWQHP
ncbi:hypothetical protein [Mycobacterium sp. 852002-51971_SCH5477799-a]|uniref:hypothetical protein n=1 Tax=Mycobacterium sp. 852002-51971_SCH5477799-a TaxID=1834106 RepID=UPI0018D44A74|nr:hypothetical protein [Mycobacterium sp. 852002-51971_SCH5477799-a]